MNYTRETIEEILQEVEKLDKKGKLAFLVGVTKSVGSIQLFKNNKFSLEYEFKDEDVTFKCYEIIKELFDIELELGVNSIDQKSYTINISGEFANNILKEMKLSHYENGEFIVEDNSKYVGDISNMEQAKSYMQGVFVSVGSVYFPSGIEEKGGYHVELVFTEEDYALAVKDMLDECHIHLSYIDRENTYSLYGKNYQLVSDMLAFVRASNMVLKLFDVNVSREANNNLNRENNFITANLDKTIIASTKQIHAIEILDKKIGLDNLDETMAKVCKARIENHEASLNELAEIVGLTKSSLNRMLNKIIKKSEELE